VFCQFLVDQPILSQHQTVYHRIRLHPTLSIEWEDDQPSSHFVLAAPSKATPIILLLSQDSVTQQKKLMYENKMKVKHVDFGKNLNLNLNKSHN